MVVNELGNTLYNSVEAEAIVLENGGMIKNGGGWDFFWALQQKNYQTKPNTYQAGIQNTHWRSQKIKEEMG